MSEKFKKYVPLSFVICLLIAVLSYLVLIICNHSYAFADFIRGSIVLALRQIMAFVTYIFPFSLFEILLILAIPIVVLLIVWFVKKCTDNVERVRSCFRILSVALIALTLYIYLLGVSYHVTPLNEELGISDGSDMSDDELYQTLIVIQEELNSLGEQLDIEDGQTHSPHNLRSLSRIIRQSYRSLADEYEFLVPVLTVAKPIMFSGIMSDMGITGVNSFITGEANINMAFPDYYLPFTVAHEFAHQHGIARENEANFIAFLICAKSDDIYVRYSGYLNMYEYLASALYSRDKELYREVSSMLCGAAKADITAAYDHAREHMQSPLYKLMDYFNNFYLKANGTEGVISYSYVVRLCVAYYRK